MNFYGRDKEIALLEEVKRRSAHTAQFTVISGRKRVGKTTLLRRVYDANDEGMEVAYLFVGNKNEVLLCDELRRISHNRLHLSIDTNVVRLSTMLEELMAASASKNFTLIVDECHNLQRIADGIFDELKEVWTQHVSDSHINLIMCGSNHAMMTRIFDNEEAPMHGIATERILLQPLKIEVLKEILHDYNPHYSPDDLLTFCMITGGVPKYVEQLVSAGAFNRRSMMECVLSEGSFFVSEGREMLADELGNDSSTYYSILSAIAEGYTSRSDISSFVGGACGGFLEKLEKIYALITKHRPFLHPETIRNVHYGLKDNFMSFWFRYIYKHRSAVEYGDMEYLRRCVENDYDAYSKVMLEKYFRQKYRETGLYNIVVNYWEKGDDRNIDLIAVDETNRHIVIGQCIYGDETIDEMQLRQRASNLIDKQPEWTYEFVCLSTSDM